MALIKFENVSLSYPVYGGDANSFRKEIIKLATGGTINKSESHVYVDALHNLNISINEGDFVGLVGHNGSGKSSLLRLLSGIYTPTTGRLLIEGNVSALLDLGGGFDKELTGAENLRRLALLLGFAREDISLMIDDVSKFSELGSFINLPISTYSSGMIMRLMFGIATFRTPDILLVDEMFGVGDASFQLIAKRRMEDLMERSKIVILCSHNEEIIKNYCNKILVLDSGVVQSFK